VPAELLTGWKALRTEREGTENPRPAIVQTHVNKSYQQRYNLGAQEFGGTAFALRMYFGQYLNKRAAL